MERIMVVLMDGMRHNGKNFLMLNNDDELNQFINTNKLEKSVDEDIMVFPRSGNRCKIVRK